MRLPPLVLLLLASSVVAAEPQTWAGLREVNPPPEPDPNRVRAIVGATLIDGRGGAPQSDSVVVVKGAKVAAVGRRGRVNVPADAERFDAAGRYLLPGLLDVHFHTSRPERISSLLAAGFTAFRDPGRPLPVYEKFLDAARPMPRAFLTGPHFDQVPHAHPHNAVDLQSEEAVRTLIRDLHAKGASAIKIYFRLPLDLIRVACEEADKLGIPVTAHLELVRADAAIRAGLDGIEHVTSLGTALATEEDARRFEKGVRADNGFREDGRYWLWSRLDFEDNPKVDALLQLMLDRGVYLAPTLRPFDMQPGDKGATPERLAGFLKMQEFTAIAARAGVPIVASSHGPTPEANWRELDLLIDAGLSTAQALDSIMGTPALFFGAQDRLGTVEPGKAADFVLLNANPLEDMQAIRRVERVMLNGDWVAPYPEPRRYPANADLSDPLIDADGRPIDSPEQWAAHREHLKGLMAYYQYGRMPPKPETSEIIGFERERSSDGKAWRERFRLRLRRNGRSAEVRVSVVRPAAPGRFPVVVKNDRYTFDLAEIHDPRKRKQYMDEGRGETDEWVFAEAVKRGYAVVKFNREDVALDQPDNRRSGVFSLYPEPEYDWATIAAWAWFYQPLIDQLVKQD